MHRLLAVATFLFIASTQLSLFYLYFYPVFHRCAFPTPSTPESESTPQADRSAPFRLLVLGDPQLEGDTSLPTTKNGLLPSLERLKSISNIASTRERLEAATHHLEDLFSSDIPRILQFWRKKLDLLGNDYYLAHIYRSVHRWTDPTHVAVVGDLIGSQWVSDEEFERRGNRYWGRVFRKGTKVEDDIMNGISIAPLGQDEGWKDRIINVAGNHDIGYGGDITRERLERFETMYGKANWQTRFTLPLLSPDSNPADGTVPDSPALSVVVLNSLNLDPPVLDWDLQAETYRYMNDVIAASYPVEDSTSATILLTHLPLHKDAGICVDGPLIEYYEGGALKEQNHLSYDAGKAILEGIYGMNGDSSTPAQGMGRNGIILNGHDHHGCDVYHHLPGADEPSARLWTAEVWNASSSRRHNDVPGIREITVRSLMGDFGGNAGLLSAWYDAELRKWQFEYSTCELGAPHIWWAVHVASALSLALLISLGLGYGMRLYGHIARKTASRDTKEKML